MDPRHFNVSSLMNTLEKKEDILLWLGPEGAPAFIRAFKSATGRELTNADKAIRVYVRDLGRKAYTAKGKKLSLGPNNLKSIVTRVKAIINWAHPENGPWRSQKKSPIQKQGLLECTTSPR